MLHTFSGGLWSLIRFSYMKKTLLLYESETRSIRVNTFSIHVPLITSSCIHRLFFYMYSMCKTWNLNSMVLNRKETWGKIRSIDQVKLKKTMKQTRYLQRGKTELYFGHPRLPMLSPLSDNYQQKTQRSSDPDKKKTNKKSLYWSQESEPLKKPISGRN